MLLASTGVVWLLSSTGVLDVSPLVWLGALLVLVGAALVIVPRGGHVGVLIALGIILSLTGAAASTIDTHLLSGGAGDRTVRPQSIGDLQHYKLGAGSLQIDLTAFAGDLEPVPVKATLGVGEIVVTVPADAELDVTSHVSVGEIVIRGERRSGVDVDFNARFQGASDRCSCSISRAGWGRSEWRTAMGHRLTGGAVAGVTFLVIGALLIVEAVSTIDIPAGALAAILLIGLGLAVLARAERK